MDAPIRNYMTEQPYSISPDETLQHAHKKMQEHDIRHLPVLSDRKVVGIISERDFALVHLYPEMDLRHSKVGDLMMQSVYEVGPFTPLKDVVAEMAEQKIGAAVVVDYDEHLLGIFTSIDALRLLARIYDR